MIRGQVQRSAKVFILGWVTPPCGQRRVTQPGEKTWADLFTVLLTCMNVRSCVDCFKQPVWLKSIFLGQNYGPYLYL